MRDRMTDEEIARQYDADYLDRLRNSIGEEIASLEKGERMNQEKFEVQAELTAISCADCSMFFAVSIYFVHNRQRDHQIFYCPAGHSNIYPSKSEIEIVQDKAENAIREVQTLKNCIEGERKLLRVRDYQVRYYKGELTKVRKKRDISK